MKNRSVVNNIYEASEFNSWQEAIDWIESTLSIGSGDHYTVSSKVSTVPPISIKINLYEEFFSQNGIGTDEPIYKMGLVFTMDKDNTMDDFIELKHHLFKHLNNIQGIYYDYDIQAYVINYDAGEGGYINLFDYYPKR